MLMSNQKKLKPVSSFTLSVVLTEFAAFFHNKIQKLSPTAKGSGEDSNAAIFAA